MYYQLKLGIMYNNQEMINYYKNPLSSKYLVYQNQMYDYIYYPIEIIVSIELVKHLYKYHSI